ncbi:mitochondrial methylglutaconyl-CoA hydratase-like protein [Rhizodiscina lignyota]|uniref:Mitochondrial methylglutaconyl-CoA hydratase-like protein n=1 Tax=Rhizodiscina lignyota TaxID=1504668 RepID=A0A9P4IFG3_9PEZI|nr:mitochondrial methylglutaconyl-CoA hydratase-like protein [Rhizodiscina lignyota]
MRLSPSTAFALRQTCLSTIRRKAYSTAPPCIKITSVPAPHSGSIKILSLDRPAARNALSRQLMAELGHEIQSIHDEGEMGSTRALVLASEVDASFCAGADLKERATFTQEDTARFLANLRSTFTSIAKLPIPTISAVSSLAFGGGLELALTTHLRVFASTAIVALPETRLAILPGAGGTYRLPALIGLPRARDLILTGRRVTGPEAYFLGIADRLVECQPEEAGTKEAREKVLEITVQVAREICEGGPIAIRQALKAVNGWEEGEAAENRAYEGVVKTQDRDEALLAFREKRKPVFKGR